MPEASGIPITPKPINRSSPPDGISAADSSFAAKVLRDVMVTAPCSPCTGHSFLYVPSGKGDSLGPGDNLFHHLGCPDDADAFCQLVFGDTPRLGTGAAEPHFALVGNELGHEIAELRQTRRLDALGTTLAIRRRNSCARPSAQPIAPASKTCTVCSPVMSRGGS